MGWCPNFCLQIRSHSDSVLRSGIALRFQTR
jgi:hypothetical protein